MNLNPVDEIRKNSRDSLILKRRMQRDELKGYPKTDLFDTSEREQNALKTINKLKTKSSIVAQELNVLKNVLFEQPDYIEKFMGVNGALRGLIREFTGTEVQKQYEAAACLCNLALGDSKACHTVTKSSGTYLVASLDSLNTELAVTSAWTIGNLAGSGPRTCEALIAQGAISKLVEMLTNTKTESLQDGVIYALEHFVYSMKDDLNDDSLQKIIQALKLKSGNIEFSRLLFLVSCHHNYLALDLVEDEFIGNLLNTYIYALQKRMDFIECDEKEFANLLYVTRTLANVCISETVCDGVLNQLVKHNLSLISLKLCNSPAEDIRNSQMWLIGNLLNFASESDLKEQLFNIICDSENEVC